MCGWGVGLRANTDSKKRATERGRAEREREKGGVGGRERQKERDRLKERQRETDRQREKPKKHRMILAVKQNYRRSEGRDTHTSREEYS